MKRIIQCTHCGVSKTVEYTRFNRTPCGWIERYDWKFGQRRQPIREVVCPECIKRGVK